MDRSTAAPSSFDALLPPQIAARAAEVGAAKARMDAFPTTVLAILAGAFIGLGASFATVATTGATGVLPFGVTRLLAGVVFSLGLILVVAAGAELFTGNNLIVIAWADRRITVRKLLRNWALVYAGNLAGAVATAFLVYAAASHGGQHHRRLVDGGTGLLGDLPAPQRLTDRTRGGAASGRSWNPCKPRELCIRTRMAGGRSRGRISP